MASAPTKLLYKPDLLSKVINEHDVTANSFTRLADLVTLLNKKGALTEELANRIKHIYSFQISSNGNKYYISSQMLSLFDRMTTDLRGTKLTFACQFFEEDVAFTYAYPHTVNLPDAKGRYPVHLLAQEGKTEALKDVRKMGANFSVLCQGRSVLHYACRSGSLETVKAVVAQDNCNGQSDVGDTPLLIALKWEHYHIADYLLDAFDVNIWLSDSLNMAPIHVAARKNQLALVKRLNDTRDMRCSKGHTALDLSCRKDYREQAAYLLSIGTKFSERYRSYIQTHFVDPLVEGWPDRVTSETFFDELEKALPFLTYGGFDGLAPVAKKLLEVYKSDIVRILFRLTVDQNNLISGFQAVLPSIETGPSDPKRQKTE